MIVLKRLFGNRDKQAMLPLYNAIVAAARQPHWYAEGDVPDTIDGRFDMVAALTALVLLRLERDDDARSESALLAELFVDDMDGQLREIGIGDLVVGKHIGKMMGALGGRLGAFRAALDGEGALAEVLRRNIYRDGDVSAEALAHSENAMADFLAALHALSTREILRGKLA